MSGPLVSILVCTYNGERYLERQINSLVSQTYTPIEIIVVDDASEDSTPAILEKYQDIENISIFYNSANKGFTVNFRDGLQLCNGEFVALCDQDDIWNETKINILVNSIGLNDVIYHDSRFIDENDHYLNVNTSTYHKFVKGNCSRSLIYQNAAPGHAMMIRRSFTPKFTPLPAKIYHDWWIAFCASCHSSLAFINDELVEYRVHRESYTQLNSRTTFEERLLLLSLFENYSRSVNADSYPTLQKLNTLYKEKKQGRFSIQLFIFLVAHMHSLFYIRRRSLWSKIKNLVAESKI